ncbi:MAG: tripartite tricarboxylate transporter permease, partial [Deltaproteobacteria bacterium]|nr:tripartite tricarboxylate transporter permease [Deltaproteobacteria bacterium]
VAMMELFGAFVSGFTQVFTETTFLLMLVGIGIGFVVGILPGLGGPATIALLLPFIVKMPPVQAFALLLGMASVLGTTGDITSILFGVPGEPTSAATIIDGHAMAKRGEAGRALGAVLMSSLIGAIFGAFVLACSVPVIRPLILKFASPELFMLALLGLTFVSSLSSEALLKGLLAAGIGLFLSTIGLNPVSGTQRFTFGQVFLWDGIGLVPITMGFFAIPELIEMGVQRGGIAREQIDRLGGVWEGIRDTFIHWKLVIRASALGTFIAMIPGMGPSVSQWLAYAQAVQSSPDKSRFGKGAVEGVLGPGAANNSSMGGSLLTTVAFGVPASVLMAILLGAFLIQGIIPGPEMLQPEAKGGHLSLTFSFVWIIVVSNLITVALCLIFLKQLVKITYLRAGLLVPFIIVLIYLGTFAEKNAFPDLLLMLLFGLIGWAMERLEWPRPPLILGLVLGNLAESRLFLTVGNYGLSWLLRPGVLIILALTVTGAVYPFLRRRWLARKAGPATAGGDAGEAPASLAATFRFNGAMAFSLTVACLMAWALWESRHFDLKSGLFPWLIGFPVFGLAVVQFIWDGWWRRAGRPPLTAEHGGEEPTLSRREFNCRTVKTLGWICGFILPVWLLGFRIGAPLCAFVHLRWGEKERWPLSLILAAAIWAFIYFVLEKLLHVPFPAGELLAWLWPESA